MDDTIETILKNNNVYTLDLELKLLRYLVKKMKKFRKDKELLKQRISQLESDVKYWKDNYNLLCNLSGEPEPESEGQKR